MSLFNKARGYGMGQADQKRAMKYIHKLETANRELGAKYNKLTSYYHETKGKL